MLKASPTAVARVPSESALAGVQESVGAAWRLAAAGTPAVTCSCGAVLWLHDLSRHRNVDLANAEAASAMRWVFGFSPFDLNPSSQ